MLGGGVRTDLQKHTGCNRLSLLVAWPMALGKHETFVVVEQPWVDLRALANFRQSVTAGAFL